MDNFSSPTVSKQAKIYICAGIAALIVVHAIGRFAFTPLLPYFIQDGMFSIEQGANLATLNYAGYLIGALSAVKFSQAHQLKPLLLISLILNCFCTLLQCWISNFDALLILRLLNGITNGIVFVLAPSLILEWLVTHQKTHLSGLVYLGVSIGLILDSILIDWTANLFTGAMRWLPVAFFSIPLTLYSVFYLNQIVIQPPHSSGVSSSQKLFDHNTTPLFIAYAGAGLGYILPMTFLPTLAHDVASQHAFWVKNVWLVTALACLIFLPFWNWLGAKFTDCFALLGSYLMQIIGVAGVLIFPNIFGILICAIFMGASFMGTVVSSQRIAKFFQPQQGAKLYALLISLYAGTQLLGPWLAKLYIQNGGTLLHSFSFGLIALIWGFIWTFKVPKYA
ncbi:YbfB/YjiJ family MFS transporter [Acinetobacter puyangensis]|uniref:Predicted arabinose efflux permease, MFS family n=1 Tax=Acinetobacter puyangensis TaxID=1096779 RepID=A0A240E4N8_9GAMM|nr:YbfB/YjiJ family MFS transporter [Acinetobacter puyangensis]SNX43536.1 Predicted arabinose efflux permease, MFS family [Acinetobacter puyangensis]